MGTGQGADIGQVVVLQLQLTGCRCADCGVVEVGQQPAHGGRRRAAVGDGKHPGGVEPVFAGPHRPGPLHRGVGVDEGAVHVEQHGLHVTHLHRSSMPRPPTSVGGVDTVGGDGESDAGCGQWKRADVLTTDDLDARNRLITSLLDRLEDALRATQTAVRSLRDLLGSSTTASIELRSVAATLAVAITAVVDTAELGPWFRGAFGELDATLAASGVRPAGPVERLAIYPWRNVCRWLRYARKSHGRRIAENVGVVVGVGGVDKTQSSTLGRVGWPDDSIMARRGRRRRPGGHHPRADRGAPRARSTSRWARTRRPSWRSSRATA